LFLFVRRFCLFRRALDAEIKSGAREGLHIKFKKKEKEFVSEEEEEMFWKQGLLGTDTAKSLLNTVYFYNGFGLRGGEHRNMVVNNLEIGTNFIRFENVSKTYYGGLSDLKYIPRVVKHVCYEIGAKHERCLVDIYRLYIRLVQTVAKQCQAFYFRPSTKKFGYEKSLVGINTLNKMLPEMCQAVGVRRKTTHSLRVTCSSSLFNVGVEEKIIRQRTGHRSDAAIFHYEKPTEENIAKVSAILGPNSNPMLK
jgi:integrase